MGTYIDSNGLDHGFLATPSKGHGDDIATGAVNAFFAGAGLRDATPTGTLTVSPASTSGAKPGDGLGSIPMGQTTAVVKVSSQFLTSGDAGMPWTLCSPVSTTSSDP